MSQPTAQPPAQPTAAPPPAPPVPTEEERIRSELQDIFIELLTSAQELSYEMATLEPKDAYTKEEIKDLLEACRRVVSNVKRMHMFLRVHARRR
jgi:cob(I)alamin adenosyltransferase